jgi:cell filamentation protein, protein adenylyltransferase
VLLGPALTSTGLSFEYAAAMSSLTDKAGSSESHPIEISGTAFCWEDSQTATLRSIADRVRRLRELGTLSPQALRRLSSFFRVKDIYNSNAIEGNLLSLGETRQVLEEGITLTGKPLKDQAEAKNLGFALDHMEALVQDPTRPVLEQDVRELHRFVLAGIDDANAGRYRTGDVEISGSQFRPPAVSAVPGEMDVFGKWLSATSVPGDEVASIEGLLRAVVAHTWFVQIHPFIDGNGRVARLLMNLVLMRYQFPIAIITKADRERYYDALEISQSSDLSAILALVTECLHESLEEYEAAVAEDRKALEWTQSLAAQLEQPVITRARNEYEVWKSAMELMRSYFQQTVAMIDEQLTFGRVYFKDFGMLEPEKYLLLRQGESAKHTWFFRVDFRTENRAARYLFWFGRPSAFLRRETCEVTAHLSREEPPGSFYYESLQSMTAPNVPDLFEIGYRPDKEQFVALYRSDKVRLDRIEAIGRRFLEEIVRLHFQSP